MISRSSQKNKGMDPRFFDQKVKRVSDWLLSGVTKEGSREATVSLKKILNNNYLQLFW